MPTLRDVVPDIEPIHPEEVVAQGRRRGRRRQLLGALAGAAVLALVLIVAVTWLPGLNRLAQPADPPGIGITHAPDDTPACPQPTRGPKDPVEMASYARLVVWGQKHYLQVDGQAPLGRPGAKLGTVPCNIVEINDRAGKVWTGAWPDGSSTIAKVGTPIHAQVGSDPTCELTLRLDGAWQVFRAEGC